MNVFSDRDVEGRSKKVGNAYPGLKISDVFLDTYEPKTR